MPPDGPGPMPARVETVPRSVSLLEDALGLTGEMLDACRGDNWQRVTELGARRQELLDAAFTTAMPASRRIAARRLLQEILDLNEQLVIAGRRQREQLGQALKQLGTGRRAHRAYTAHARN